MEFCENFSQSSGFLPILHEEWSAGLGPGLLSNGSAPDSLSPNVDCISEDELRKVHVLVHTPKCFVVCANVFCAFPGAVNLWSRKSSFEGETFCVKHEWSLWVMLVLFSVNAWFGLDRPVVGAALGSPVFIRVCLHRLSQFVAQIRQK